MCLFWDFWSTECEPSFLTTHLSSSVTYHPQLGKAIEKLFITSMPTSISKEWHQRLSHFSRGAPHGKSTMPSYSLPYSYCLLQFQNKYGWTLQWLSSIVIFVLNCLSKYDHFVALAQQATYVACTFFDNIRSHSLLKSIMSGCETALLVIVFCNILLYVPPTPPLQHCWSSTIWCLHWGS